jgi:hypothetical protein
MFLWVMALLAVYAVGARAQTANPAGTPNAPLSKKNQGTQAAGANLPVQGSGTLGRLTKWTGLTSSNSLIGDTTIFESKTGLVGIGTDLPTSKLTVQGMIETTLGGYKFPDGTVQTTAAVAGLQAVIHDATLKGNGTQASPLALAVPLTLSGAGAPVLKVINTGTDIGSDGIQATGGNTNNFSGGAGVRSRGGDALTTGSPGPGVSSQGGDSLMNGTGGNGVETTGGKGFVGGNGVYANGGSAVHLGVGGNGLFSTGGSSANAGDFVVGGTGILARGGDGVGTNFNGGVGIHAIGGQGLNGATPGLAASFSGDVEVGGNFSVTGGTKNFKIDHPLDPENKYLYHAAIESSEVLNIYSGNITTDESGEALVTLPGWFEAINKDFRYQLTVLGTFAQAIVADEIKNNHFKIKTNAAGVKVSWQVTGIRSDAAMLKHPFKVEEDKSSAERGFYLTPEAYGQPEERGVEWARNPQLMQQLKVQRTQNGQTRQQQ